MHRLRERVAPAPENFGDESTALAEKERGDVDGGENELRLNVLVHVVQTCDIRSTIAHYQICLDVVKVAKNLTHCFLRRDVPLNGDDSVKGGDFLQVDRYNLRGAVLLPQPAGKNLAPAAGRSAQINRACHSCKQTKLFI